MLDWAKVWADEIAKPLSGRIPPSEYTELTDRIASALRLERISRDAMVGRSNQAEMVSESLRVMLRAALRELDPNWTNSEE